MKMSLPGLIIESVQPAVGYIAFICLVQFIFNSDDSPDIFLIFYEPFASHAYSLLFYCHSYVWMVWSAASVGSLTVQIKRFSSFATLLVFCVCLCLLCHTLDAHLSSNKTTTVLLPSAVGLHTSSSVALIPKKLLPITFYFRVARSQLHYPS